LRGGVQQCLGGVESATKATHKLHPPTTSSDIVGQLAAKGASSTGDFEWQMQLRYYWQGDDLVVKQVPLNPGLAR